MNQSLFFEEHVVFSPHMPPEVNQLLQAAVALTPVDKAQAEQLFKQAHSVDNSCLQSYFALYKFYFYQGRLQEAEREVIAALEEAARQGHFPCDYKRLARGTSKWDMYANEITAFYLYSLKALAFIKLRQHHDVEARVILSLMQELDPEDRSGASVILGLSEALDEGEDNGR